MANYAPVAPTEHELTATPRWATPASGTSEVISEHDPWTDELKGLYRDQDPRPPSSPAIFPQDRLPSMQDGKPPTNRRRLTLIIVVILLIVLAAAGAALGVVLSKRTVGSAAKSGGTSSSVTGPAVSPTPTSGTVGATSGKSGSIVIFEDGTKYTYKNDFGGDWALDPRDPFAPGGKAQSWSPRVGADQWTWGKDIVRGVNLGGWLMTEPFIVPALYEEYIGKVAGIDVVDEWTLSLAMGSDLATRMEQHYKTFITEQDFAEIAAAGLNWVRIPIGFWAIGTINNEPFLPRTSWTYFLKAIQWARKYGLRIYLDLHALPGGQNGWNHDGKVNAINFMYGTMGIANAQRTLSYLRTIVQFVSQPQYKDVIPMVGIVNEILYTTIGKGPVQSYYYAAYEAIRKATGVGQGPYIAIHEGFQMPAVWEGFLAGSDRVILDWHPYLAFQGTMMEPAAGATAACGWGTATNQSSRVFGVTVAGEFATAINNCGLWLNGIGSESGAGCAQWDNWSAYSAETIAGLKRVTLASMDGLQNYFYWTWKIGNSTRLGTSSCPLWHYKLGLQQGWVPQDPREAVGFCASLVGAPGQPFDGVYPATATGGPGAGTLDAAMRSSNTFPPATISPSFSGAQIALMPTYTPTGPLQTLPGPTFTAAPTVSVGSGWFNPADNQPAYVPIQACPYPNAWDATGAALPAATCS